MQTWRVDRIEGNLVIWKMPTKRIRMFRLRNLSAAFERETLSIDCRTENTPFRQTLPPNEKKGFRLCRTVSLTHKSNGRSR